MQQKHPGHAANAYDSINKIPLSQRPTKPAINQSRFDRFISEAEQNDARLPTTQQDGPIPLRNTSQPQMKAG